MINKITFESILITFKKNFKKTVIVKNSSKTFDLIIEPTSSIEKFSSSIFINDTEIINGKYVPIIKPFKINLGEIIFYKKFWDNVFVINIENLEGITIDLTETDFLFTGTYANKFFLRNSPVTIPSNRNLDVYFTFDATNLITNQNVESDININNIKYGSIKTKTQNIPKLKANVIIPKNFYQKSGNNVDIELTNISKQNIKVFDNLNNEKLITYAGVNIDKIGIISDMPIEIEKGKKNKITFNMDASNGIIGNTFISTINITTFGTITQIPIKIPILNFDQIIVTKNINKISKKTSANLALTLELQNTSTNNLVELKGFTLAGTDYSLYKITGLPPKFIPKGQKVNLYFEVDATKITKPGKINNKITLITDIAPLLIDLSLKVV